VFTVNGWSEFDTNEHHKLEKRNDKKILKKLDFKINHKIILRLITEAYHTKNIKMPY